MATVSNPATFSSIKTVFGVDGDPTLRDYYRGGSRVLNLTPYSGVSSSSSGVSVRSFAGLVAPLIYMQSIDETWTAPDANEAATNVNFYANGQCQVLIGDNTGPQTMVQNFTWLLGGSNGNYGIRVTSNSNWNLNGMSLNTNYALSTTRNFSAVCYMDSEINASCNFSIVDQSLGTTIGSWTAATNLSVGLPA